MVYLTCIYCLCLPVDCICTTSLMPQPEAACSCRDGAETQERFKQVTEAALARCERCEMFVWGRQLTGLTD